MKYEDLDENAVVVVCSPASLPHVAESSIKQCDFCGIDVWFAKTTESTVPDEYYIMCMPCAADNGAMEEGELQMPSDDQIRDVAKAVGKSFEAVKADIVAVLQSSKYEGN